MPLSGIRVIDLTLARAGPTAVRQLADWGATVVRIESPDGGSGALSGSHTSYDYMNLHRNKRLMNLDLKSDEGREAFYRLLDQSDVVVENFRAPVKKRLGVDYDTLAARKPDLVYGSISGYGQDGPYAEKGAVDQIIQGMAGLMSVTGHPGQGPVRAGIALSDMAAGHQLALGLMVALYERQASGKGQWVQVSLLQAMISFMDFQATKWTVEGEVAGQAGNNHPTNSPMGTYEASDGYLNIAASNNRLWDKFYSVANVGGVFDDPDFATSESRREHREKLEAVVQDVLHTRSVADWVAILDEAGVPCGPVNTVDKVFADPQVQHLGVTAEVDHPIRGPVALLRTPIRMTRTSPATPTAPPTPGQHTDEILGELGYSAEEIERMREGKVV